MADRKLAFLAAHALLIGVGSYANAPRLDAPITADDASALAAVLRDPQYCGYAPERVVQLSNAAASRQSVLAALAALAERAQPDDTVVIFYAGHGVYGSDGYYLTTHDTKLFDHKVVPGTGLRDAELLGALRDIKARRVLLIVNACHSGEISPVLAAEAQPPPGATPPTQLTGALLGTGEGRVIISACRDGQYSFVGPGPLTLFTQALVDGLHGKGVSSNRGYISVFDLYTHLYFALDEAVQREVPAEQRRRYGEQQEPELTILKGVGPFPVALWRGAVALGEFEATASPPEGTAVRQVNPAYSQAMLRQHLQSIGGNARVGVAVAGDVHGNITHTEQRGGINLGSGNTIGSVGDLIAGDTITTGDTSGSGIAIGRGAQSTVRQVSTGGGDYAEGSIDKRSGTFVRGDEFNMAGNFSGATLNITSTLSSVSQNLRATPVGDTAIRAQLQALIEQLSAVLQQAPADKASEAEAVAETARAAVEQASKAPPNTTLVQISAEGLKQAAQNLAAVLPSVLPLASQIADALRKLVGA